MRKAITRAEWLARARAGYRPMQIDGGRSYQRWYKARRALGLPTHEPWLTPEAIRKRQRDYMRDYMREYRKRKKGLT